VEAGLTACHHTPYGVVVVLGHPHYYPRFGFTPPNLIVSCGSMTSMQRCLWCTS
jgi:predicted N-acetyltransferase YhbS